MSDGAEAEIQRLRDTLCEVGARLSAIRTTSMSDTASTKLYDCIEFIASQLLPGKS